MISVVVNLDTRPGWKDRYSSVTETGCGVCGVRSVDFFTDGIAAIRRFFNGHEIELIAYVDEHEPLDVPVDADKLIVATHDSSKPQWNDHLYLNALSYAKGDYVCHIDQDMALFRHPDADVVSILFKYLEVCKIACYPLLTTCPWYASTRFFICKREDLPIDELRWCVDHLDEAVKKYPIPDVTEFTCLEQAMTGVVKGMVMYPDAGFIAFSWINYRMGLLRQLAALPFSAIVEWESEGLDRVTPFQKFALHVGCGPIRIASHAEINWINIDIEPSHKPDLVLDCLKLSEHFGENYADYIWSCHHLEHMAYPEGVLKCLDEFRRVLKPGGIVRIASPNLAVVAKAYVEGSDLTFMYGKNHKGYYYKDTPAERFLYFMRAWQHTFVPDPDQITGLLTEVGFRNIQIKAPNESAIPGWRHDRFIPDSLYVEASK